MIIAIEVQQSNWVACELTQIFDFMNHIVADIERVQMHHMIKILDFVDQIL